MTTSTADTSALISHGEEKNRWQRKDKITNSLARRNQQQQSCFEPSAWPKLTREMTVTDSQHSYSETSCIYRYITYRENAYGQICENVHFTCSVRNLWSTSQVTQFDSKAQSKRRSIHTPSGFGATAGSDGVLASNLSRKARGKPFSLRKYAFWV